MSVRTRPIPVIIDAVPAPRRGNALASASLVLAAVGLAVGIVPLFIGLILSFLPAVLGLVLGAVGFARSFSGRSGRSRSVAGFTVALLTMVLWVHGYGVIW